MTTRIHVVLGSLPAGHYYRVGDDVFVDQPFVSWMRSKVDPVEREWIVFPFKKFGLFVRDYTDERRLPGQEGLLFEVRQDLDRDNDRQAAIFLDTLLRLGALAHGGAFQSWSDVEVYWRSALRRAAEDGR